IDQQKQQNRHNQENNEIGGKNLDNNQIIPRNLTTAPFATSYSSDPSIYLFYDKCTFTLDKSIQLYPEATNWTADKYLYSWKWWARKFDSETSTTYLYKVSSNSLVVATSDIYADSIMLIGTQVPDGQMKKS
ncbi:26068_t:CDS:2, partial [Gigaspora margarita]